MTEDTAEALAASVQPFDLVREVPGVEHQQASRSGEPLVHDPDSPDRGMGDDDVGEDGDDEGVGSASGIG